MTARRLRNRTGWGAVGLALLTCAAFSPVVLNGFILLDDPDYVTGNPRVGAGLSAAGLRWALTATDANNWHPLTWASHMLDVSLFGLNPGGHHLAGLAIHATTAVLLFLILRAMTGALFPSALTAALFAVHPLHVESVAWASERKDLLAGLFWVLTMGAHLRYTRRPGAGRLLVLAGIFFLGLAAKPMLVTLPFALLLLDAWPLGRFAPASGGAGRLRWCAAVKLIVEKLPLFALAAGASAVTFLVQRDTGAVKGLDLLPLVPRVLNALHAYGTYLARTVWPFGLSPVYTHPGPDLPIAAAVAAGAGVLVVTLVVLRRRRAQPWLAVGWAWYLGTLLPVIGIVQVGWQGMADRYTYLPLIGPFFALVWQMREPAARWPARRAPPAAALLLVGLAALTFRQTLFWRDSVTLFTRAVAVSPDNLLAELYLGKAHRGAGNHEEAARHLREAIRINPRIPEAHYQLGLSLIASGDFAAAVGPCRRAVQLLPDDAAARNNLGWALEHSGDPERALEQYRAALRIEPGHERARFNAGMLLVRVGREQEAAAYLR